MIEINLATKGKESGLDALGGINLSLVNVKFCLLGFLCIYLLEPLMGSFYEPEIKLYEKKFQERNLVVRKKLTELSQYDQVKDQVAELEEQQRALKQKIGVVKAIVDKRQNPFNVLKYVAENTPRDVWLVELVLDNKELKLLGYSTSWKSIGDYIENLKTSIFFNGDVSYSKPTGMDSKVNKTRIESFEIKTEVVGF